jgi:hypothetical protein
LSNPSGQPHRSYRTLRDGSFGVRCPRHFVPGYDRAVPPGPVLILPSYRPVCFGGKELSKVTILSTEAGFSK